MAVQEVQGEASDQLTDEQYEQVEKWIADKEVGNCPSCGHEEFTVGSYLAKVQTVGGGRMFPMLLLICSKCADTRTFSAVRLGLVAGKPE